MKIRLFLFLFALFSASSSFAVTVDHLYQAEVTLPLITNEQDVIEKAYDVAVEQVLVKVSGDADAVKKVLPAAQKSVSKWVAQHAIRDEQELQEIDGKAYALKVVTVNFYPALIDDFLFDKGLPVWGANRPSVLMWVVEQKNFARKIAGVNAPSEMLNDMAADAKDRGLAMFAPLQDDLDKQSMDVPDLWGLFDDPILKASKRYQTDVVGVFKVTKLPNSYDGTLMLMLPNELPIRFYLDGDTVEDITTKVNVSIAKVFSERYAAVRTSGKEQTVVVQVSNITNHEALDKVQGYLGQLGVVSNIHLQGIKGDEVQFALALNGDVVKMVNTINLDSIIVKASADMLDPSMKDVKTYRYNGASK